MALTPAPTLGPPTIDQFSPSQPRTARLFASDPALPSLVDPDEEESRWVELDSSPFLQIWLLSWPDGTHNEWHDHGESIGAFQVVSGTLPEQTSIQHRCLRRPAERSPITTLCPGLAGPNCAATKPTAADAEAIETTPDRSAPIRAATEVLEGPSQEPGERALVES